MGDNYIDRNSIINVEVGTDECSSSVSAPAIQTECKNNKNKKDFQSQHGGPIKKLKLLTNSCNNSIPENPDTTDGHNINCENDHDIVDTSSIVTHDDKIHSKFPSVGLLPRAALDIDHILELIIFQLDEEALFNCRSVCHRWRILASKRLQQFAAISFKQPEDQDRQQPGFYSFLGTQKDFPYKPDPSHPIEDLITVMSNSAEFPCTSFKFFNTSIINPAAQPFLNTHGPWLKTLELIAFDHTFTPCSICINDLKRILLVQAPNIEHLILDGRVVCDKSSPTNLLPQRDEKKQSGKSNSKNSNLCPSLKLKVLEITDHMPLHILEEILNLSPKLMEVKLVKNEMLHLLVKPLNRLHLLKTLDIFLSRRTISSLEALADHHGGNWALRKLSLEGAFMVALEHDMLPRATNIVSKILDGCASSLRSLKLGQLQILEGLHFPQMPNVTELDLTLKYYNIYVPGLSTQFFPPGVSISKAFPKLKFVRIFCDLSDVPINTVLTDLTPVTSVKRVVLCDLVNNESFRALFPNATISKWGDDFK